ncbi:MAG: hypothetical protein JSV49_02300 [Thermoplasmata archaeon]|nr:MAG: hypothetical protein JSV49_02300 [Thermoplasmata archaeon]
MICNWKVFGIFWLAVILLISIICLPGAEATTRAVTYSLDISDYTDDVTGDNFGGDIVSDADITSLKSSEATGIITFELTVDGTIHGSTSAGYIMYTYEFFIDVDYDGYEDWTVWVMPDPIYIDEFYASMEDDEEYYDYTLDADDVTGDGTSTLTVKFPLSYISDEIYGWDVYVETFHYDYSDEDYYYWEDAYDSAPDSGFSFDPYGDDDYDGMENWYEQKYGLDPDDSTDASLDPDGDNFTNLEEFNYYSDPTSPSSHPPLLNNTINITITKPYEYETIYASEDYYDYYTITGTATPPSSDSIYYVEWRVQEALYDGWEDCEDLSFDNSWTSWEAYIPTYSLEDYGYLSHGYNTLEVRVITTNNNYNTAEVIFYFDAGEIDDYDDYEYWTVRFTGKTVDVYGPFDVWFEGTFEVNTKSYPKEIDIKVTDNSEDPIYNGETLLGIYEIYEDILFISLNEPGITSRPTTYEDEGDNTVFYLIQEIAGSGATELEGNWYGTAISYYSYLDDDIYEWDEFFEDYPFTKTPTDTSIDVEISSATLSFQIQWDRDSFYVLIKGTTSGVDHCKITFVSYYKDGSYDDWVYWEEEIDMKEFDDEIMEYMAEYGFETWHFKPTSDNWTTWEYKLNSTFTYDEMNLTDFNDLDMSDLEEIYDEMIPIKMEIYVRAYADAGETKWNQDMYEVKINRGTKGNSINIDFVGESTASIEYGGQGETSVEPIQERFLDRYSIDEDSFGDDFENIGQFILIMPVGDTDVKWVNITIQYDPDKLPSDFSEENFKIYYFDEDTEKWVECEITGVDTENHLIYANVTHLTIFAPMAESGGGGPGGGGDDDDDDDEPGGTGTGTSDVGLSLTLILALVAVVFVIAIAAGMIIVRKRKAPAAPQPPGAAPAKPSEGQPPQPPAGAPAEDRPGKPAPPPPPDDDDFKETEMVEPDWEEDEEPEVELSELETKTKNCPKCKTSINVSPSFDDKISLQCPSCGSKGKIPNPYLDDIEQLRERKETDTLFEFDDENEDDFDLPPPPPPPPPDD